MRTKGAANTLEGGLVAMSEKHHGTPPRPAPAPCTPAAKLGLQRTRQRPTKGAHRCKITGTEASEGRAVSAQNAERERTRRTHRWSLEKHMSAPLAPSLKLCFTVALRAGGEVWVCACGGGGADARAGLAGGDTRHQ
jgi:hypothetical protein